MSINNVFQTGYLKVSAQQGEEIFLSVTPGFERGPGIERDGITLPRMTDPHTVERVMVEKHLYALSTEQFPFTTNAWVQRAGTWTLFNHLKAFLQKHGKEHLVIGVQSCGDLTMNPWHVALIHREGKKSGHDKAELCYLKSERMDGFEEPIGKRSYRCLVKWKPGVRECSYEFIDLKFSEVQEGFQSRIVDQDFLKDHAELLEKKNINPNNISDSIEFALSGKPIVERGRDISMPNAIDRFQDIRHIFNLPEVAASGAIGFEQISKINFGEHILYNNLNARRAALSSAILVDLKIENTEVRWEDLKSLLLAKKHYRETVESPTRRGEFRRYSDKTVEIFFPHNVYPFGVLGGKPGELVCLSCGGLSGRVGNTLEGITRITYDFFGCRDAIVLDEGFDTFHLMNPQSNGDYLYSNDQLLQQAAAFTMWRVEEDHKESMKPSPQKPKEPSETEWYHKRILKKGSLHFANWPLNSRLFSDLKQYCAENKISPRPPRELDTIGVTPFRSQMRAVIIYAVRKKSREKSREKSRLS